MPARKGAPKTGKSPTGKKVPGQRFKTPMGSAKRPNTGKPPFDAAIMSTAAYLRHTQFGISDLLRVYRHLNDSHDRLKRWSDRAEKTSAKATRKGTARRYERLADEFAEAADRTKLAYRKVEQMQDDLEYFVDAGVSVVRKLMESQDKRAVAQARRLTGQIDVIEQSLDQPHQHMLKVLASVRKIRNADISPKSAIESVTQSASILASITTLFYEMLGSLEDAVADMVGAANG